MGYKKSLISAVSALSMAAGVNSIAHAALNHETAEIDDPGRTVAISLVADHVMDFLLAVDGEFTPSSVEAAIFGIFEDFTLARASSMPAFAADLVALGLSEDVREAVAASMIEVLARSEAVDEATMDVVGSALIAILDGTEMRSAQLRKLFRFRDGVCVEDDPYDPDCAPGTTGATDPSVQGGGYGG